MIIMICSNSDLLNTNGDQVPSSPENPPVIPLLQPYLPLQGDHGGDDVDDGDDFRSHDWTPTATSSKISLLTILASMPS